ncbi:MAG: GIY-YIG nuclease family protein [Promethearchaeota archaeon]
MRFWVYMLFVGKKIQGNKRRIYTGFTSRLMSRIAQHSGLASTKGSRTTRRQRIELVYLELFPSRKKAMQREWQLKHENPFNQKEHKLTLIQEFQLNYGELLQELNTKLDKHYEFLIDIGKTMQRVERRLISEIRNK